MKGEKYTIQQIAEIVGGTVYGTSHSDKILYLVIDSRKIIFPGSSIFFAVKGPHHDGHQYIQKAIESGIQHFIISDPVIMDQHPGCCFILVKDTLSALQKLAGHHREQFNIPIVGIVGSNGKTIVKDWLSHILSAPYNVCKNPKSYNSQVGVPISVWNLQPENEIGIFEAGISEKGEMQKLEPIIRPTIGIFTNIGTAHEENFANISEKISEKLLLFKGAECIVLRNDDPAIEAMVKELYPRKKVISWGSGNTSHYHVSFIKTHGNTEIFITSGDENFSFTIPFTDPASLENAIHVFITAKYIGIDTALMVEQMKLLPRINMRLSFKTGKNNCFIIDDTYSNDFDSFKIAVDSLDSLYQFDKKTIILSDIAQSKTKKEELYKNISDILQQKKVSRIIGIGTEIGEYKQVFPDGSHFFNNAGDFLNHLSQFNFHNEAILVKGARIFEMEKIVTRLENKVHDTILEVNLNAMVHNLNYYRKHIPAGTRIMAMVKASGYGTGTHEIAHILNFHHIDYLAVAYADEGIELRNHGIKLPIMVMNAEATSYELLVERKLEPVIYNFENLTQLLEHKKNSGSIPPVHIEIDTGMHRLGFNPDTIKTLLDILKKEKEVHIKSIFSHLAASDEPEMDEFTLQQIELFKKISSEVEKTIGKPVLKHIANSAGASRFKEAAFDMIRLGVGLYGVGADAEEQAKLQPVIALYSTIAQITSVKKGESVGYGRSYLAEKDMVIATVPIGYADGYRRSLGNGKGKMYVNGQPALVVGRVCMDMTMIDVSEINASVGDRVEIIGENHPIEVFARSMETISYEVLTSISLRVRRIYTQE